MHMGSDSLGREQDSVQQASRRRCAICTARLRATYPVALSHQQRLRTGGLSATQEMRAPVLLYADRGTPPRLTNAPIARALAISPRTVVRERRRFIEQGIAAMFSGAKYSAPADRDTAETARGKQERSRASTTCCTSTRLRERTRR